MLIMIPKFLWIPLLIILVIISNINGFYILQEKIRLIKNINLIFSCKLKTKISPLFIFEVL